MYTPVAINCMPGKFKVTIRINQNGRFMGYKAKAMSCEGAKAPNKQRDLQALWVHQYKRPNWHYK